MLSISLVPETVFRLGTLPVSNSLLTSWISLSVVTLLLVIGAARARLVPRGLQIILEGIITFFSDLCENVLGDKKLAEKAMPFIATLFIFVFASNIVTVLPGVGSIGIREAHGEAGLTPLFRPASADLNTTLALAFISVIVTQIVGFKTLGVGYLKKFFNFKNPVHFFVGILELISEFAKLISFSFRLFGNIFAGEVLLAVMLMLAPYFLPIPFYGLELFVSLVQAFVFAMLTLVFIKLASTPHGEEAPAH